MIVYIPLKINKPEDLSDLKSLKEDIENQLRYGNGKILYVPQDVIVKELKDEQN